MKPNIHGLALVPALVAVAWLIPSASTSGTDTSVPAVDATAPVGPDRLHLAQANMEPVERPVTYSNDQADRGEAQYARECEECHGGNLRGGLNGGPPLRGLAFEEKYADGLPASVMFGYMSTQMPPHAPGRYSPDTYADLMAYILKWNGFQSGAPLPSELEALGYLLMGK